MPTIPPAVDPLLETTDWPRLFHAYGWATDTPAHLRALLSDNPAAHKAALDHLNSAVIHQGTAWTCTAPAALIVANLLSNPRLIAIDDSIVGTTPAKPPKTVTDGFAELQNFRATIGATARETTPPPLSAQLLSFLNEVAQVFPNSGATIAELEKLAAAPTPALDKLISAHTVKADSSDDENEDDEGAFEELFEDEETSNALYARAILECVNIRAPLLEKILPCLTAPHGETRAAAAETIATLASQISPPPQLADITSRLTAAARAAATPCERAAHILALGKLTPAAPAVTAPWLDDPAPAVRLCAALAPAQATNPRATQLLHEALSQHAAEIETWFTPRPPQFSMHARFYLLDALLARTSTLEEILPAALALIPRAKKDTVDYEWGKLLARAFPPAAATQPLTPARREFLAALTANTPLWDTHFGNPRRWFAKAALPYDRDACLRLLAT